MLAIYSCNGFAREIAVPAEQSWEVAKISGAGPADIVFVEDDPRFIGTCVNGWPVISFDDLIGPEHRHRRVNVAIAAPRTRAAVVAKCEAARLAFGSIVAPQHIRYRGVEIGEGANLLRPYDDHRQCADRPPFPPQQSTAMWRMIA